MHVDNRFVFMYLVVSMLKIEREDSLRPVCNEYIAEWAFDEVMDMFGLWGCKLVD